MREDATSNDVVDERMTPWTGEPRSGESRPDELRPGASGGGRGLVVLPTFNERESLEKIVPRILEQDDRLDVLVVDDASPDGTGDLAEEDPSPAQAGKSA